MIGWSCSDLVSICWSFFDCFIPTSQSTGFPVCCLDGLESGYDWYRLLWYDKSDRILSGDGFVEFGLVDLSGVDCLFVWHNYAWLRGFLDQEFLLFLTTYGTFTSNLCTLFPCSFFFPQGFVWQGFLMRQSWWMTTSLVVILLQDCFMVLLLIRVFLMVNHGNVMGVLVESVVIRNWTVH